MARVRLVESLAYLTWLGKEGRKEARGYGVLDH